MTVNSGTAVTLAGNTANDAVTTFVVAGVGVADTMTLNMAGFDWLAGATAAFVLLPLMLIRNIQKLSALATFSVVAIVYTAVLFVAQALYVLSTKGAPELVVGEPSPSEGSQMSWGRASAGVIKALPIFAQVFFSHPSYPLIFAELRQPKRLTNSATSMDSVANFSLLFCCLIYMAVGLSGYVYGVAEQVSSSSASSLGVVPGDALRMFPPTPAATAARFAIAVAVVGAYVSVHFTTRTCIEDLLAKLLLLQSRSHSTMPPLRRNRNKSEQGRDNKGGARDSSSDDTDGRSSGNSDKFEFTPRQRLVEVLCFLAVTMATRYQ